MGNNSGILRYMAERMADKPVRGEAPASQAAIVATEAATNQAVAHDKTLPDGWQDAAILGPPQRKEPINIRLDADVLAWFKQSGKGYQTRINNVLRAFVESRRA